MVRFVSKILLPIRCKERGSKRGGILPSESSSDDTDPSKIVFYLCTTGACQNRCKTLGADLGALKFSLNLNKNDPNLNKC